MAELSPSYNVAPTQQILVARELDGRREGVAMRWGFIPSWAKDAKRPQINARGETVAEKPMFRAAFKKRRCLIVADGYYMPVILRGPDADAWLDSGVDDAKALTPLLRPFPSNEMVAYPVSSRVNKVRENDTGLIEVEGA